MTTSTLPTHDQSMERIEAIGPSLRAGANACDEAREVLPQSMAMMQTAGLFRIPAPQHFGGY